MTWWTWRPASASDATGCSRADQRCTRADQAVRARGSRHDPGFVGADRGRTGTVRRPDNACGKGRMEAACAFLASFMIVTAASARDILCRWWMRELASPDKTRVSADRGVVRDWSRRGAAGGRAPGRRGPSRRAIGTGDLPDPLARALATIGCALDELAGRRPRGSDGARHRAARAGAARARRARCSGRHGDAATGRAGRPVGAGRRGDVPTLGRPPARPVRRLPHARGCGSHARCATTFP